MYETPPMVIFWYTPAAVAFRAKTIIVEHGGMLPYIIYPLFSRQLKIINLRRRFCYAGHEVMTDSSAPFRHLTWTLQPLRFLLEPRTFHAICFLRYGSNYDRATDILSFFL